MFSLLASFLQLEASTNFMTITKNPTPAEKACPITDLLVTVGKSLLKQGKTVDWLDLEQFCTACEKRDLQLDGKTPTPQQLEPALREMFTEKDEICSDGISITGLLRRVKWDDVFVLRFHPDVHAQPISLEPMEAEGKETGSK